ncbi:hypothetical protein CKAH01_07415 [Colletotrichum kahawae]|uniref:Uncharacterized protein n=1 Tax=Colletotrichum kahawae TaxID=34407 RepID=A0AAD9Y5T3_COLKA|nr:hypothetical protein CKAH01_07415 [Colletotrichum kahawae]
MDLNIVPPLIGLPPIEVPFAVSLKREVEIRKGFVLPQFSRACFYPSRMEGRSFNHLIPINPVVQRPGSRIRNDVIEQPVVYVPVDALEIGVCFQRSFHHGIREFDQMLSDNPSARLYQYPIFGADARHSQREVFADFYPGGPPEKFLVRKKVDYGRQREF